MYHGKFFVAAGVAAMVAAGLFAAGCTEGPPTAKVIHRDNQVFIEDRTGKEWDVTYAADELGLRPGGFQYGLGPNAIPPVLQPRFWAPGDDGYPSDESTFTVVGAVINGESRAYALSVLYRHEVIDDVIGGVPVAVSY